MSDRDNNLTQGLSGEARNSAMFGAMALLTVVLFFTGATVGHLMGFW